MRIIKASNFQTLNDIALMYYGSVVYATDIAHVNYWSVTDDIGGLDVELPEIETTSEEKKIAKQLQQLNEPLATKYPL